MKSVKVILNEDVYNLGEEGDIRQVAPGYARNYLIPQRLAVAYTKEHVALFEQKRVAIGKRKDEKRNAALGLKGQIEAIEITIEVPAGDSGKLFGSVNSAVIHEKLTQAGIQIERKKIEVPGHAIKMTGTYKVLIKLYGEESADLNVKIKGVGESEDEELQRKKAEKAAAAERRAARDAEEAAIPSNDLSEDMDGTDEDDVPSNDMSDEADEGEEE